MSTKQFGWRLPFVNVMLGIAAGGSGSLAKLQGSLGGMRIVYPSPSPTAAKMMPNPANIGGNIVVRRGAGASGVVGGPAKTVAGINGTAIRPKTDCGPSFRGPGLATNILKGGAAGKVVDKLLHA